ncbi:hypothetical protein HC251_24605 [Iamia sp. SCSIO 61187]|uniref:hypothetical protein n=1 Tax=Iamia sp. SCSIO 61187 TaxID=2722752 RepID=UPI001C639EB3|nr:hypothetical protein [Iamia sp. SCSIO 61187]QYG95298.1 hypothetical protein HC251_24605 [Iamia sp. SCSIO 61187]
MTTPDHDPQLDDGPFDDDTLAVHAVVDGEATAEQRRRVARDPALVAQVAALRVVVDAVAEPVAPPPDDVLAAIRARALDAAGPAAADEALPAEPLPAPAAPRPPADLGAARARKARRLPPLPAVAAVVVLLVLVGVTLLVTATGDGDGDTGDLSAADATIGDEESSTAGRDEADAAEGGAGGGEASAEDAPSTTAAAGAATDALLALATASFPSMADLEAAVRTVDPETLRFPADGTAGSTTAPSPADDDLAAQAFASNPAATRCDTVLRAGEPDLEPAVAATIVDLAGTPVLVLTTPVPVSDDAPTGFRLTLLNAVDCSPRGAVLR